jgi:hypothetical protein
LRAAVGAVQLIFPNPIDGGLPSWRPWLTRRPSEASYLSLVGDDDECEQKETRFLQDVLKVPTISLACPSLESGADVRASLADCCSFVVLCLRFLLGDPTPL